MKTTEKIYTKFENKFGKEYGFTNYVDFAKFWFNLNRQVAKSLFPHNFNELNKCACNSREARKPLILS